MAAPHEQISVAEPRPRAGHAVYRSQHSLERGGRAPLEDVGKIEPVDALVRLAREKRSQLLRHDLDALDRLLERAEIVGFQVGWEGEVLAVASQADLSQKIVIADRDLGEGVPRPLEKVVSEVVDVLDVGEERRIEASQSENPAREEDAKEEPPQGCVPFGLVESPLLLETSQREEPLDAASAFQYPE